MIDQQRFERGQSVLKLGVAFGQATQFNVLGFQGCLARVQRFNLLLFLLQLPIQALNGSQRHAIGIDRGNCLVAIAQLKGCSEILCRARTSRSNQPVQWAWRWALCQAQRIDDLEKLEPMEIGITGHDPGDAVLAHEGRDMQIVNQVVARFR